MTNRTDYNRTLMQGTSQLALAVGLTVGMLAVAPMAVHAQTVENAVACADANASNAAAGDASANNTVACGTFSAATGAGSVSIGYGAGVNVGTSGIYDPDNDNYVGVRSTATNATQIGNGAVANGQSGTAIGARAEANGNKSAAFGANAVAGKLATIDTANPTGPSLENDAAAFGQNATAAGNEAQAIGNNTIALGQGAVAGKATDATKQNAIAIGQAAQATGLNTIAIGQGVTSAVDNQVAIGGASATYKLGGLLGGAAGKTGAESQTGTKYWVTVDSAGNLGWQSISSGTTVTGFGATNGTDGGAAAAVNVGTFKNAVAAGSGAAVTGDDGIAIGAGASAAGKGIAIGQGVTAAAGQVVIGKDQTTYILQGLKDATRTNSGFVLGIDKDGKLSVVQDQTGSGGSTAGFGASNATGGSAAVVNINPTGSATAYNNALAAGSGATVTGNDGIALGAGATAAGGSIALGKGSTAAAGGFAFGNGVTAAANEFAFGTGTATYKMAGLGQGLDPSKTYYVGVDASGKLVARELPTTGGGTPGSTVGFKATGGAGTTASTVDSTITVGKANALALGSEASATETNSVALGAKSVAGAANKGMENTDGTSAYTIAGKALTNSVDANGVVSVSGGSGTAAINRQITGVADGRIAADSTDAVNGSQLFNVAKALDDKTNKVGTGLLAALGGGGTVGADGTLTGVNFNIGGTDYTTVKSALDGLNNRISSGTGSAGFAANQPTGAAAASASGSGAVAAGYDSKASAANTTALGRGAEATHANSTALGTGAKTERENQIVIGKSDSTTTIKGTTSAASQALVNKSTDYIMMTNANGDVAAYKAADLGFASKSDVDGLKSSVNQAFKKIDENTQGIAVAIAMTGAVSLPVNHNFGIAANWGNYDGKNAFSSSAALRLRENIVASGSLGVALDSGTVGTRLGMQVTW